MGVPQRREEKYYQDIQKILFLKTMKNINNILLVIELLVCYVASIIDHLEIILEYLMKPQLKITKKSTVYYVVNHYYEIRSKEAKKTIANGKLIPQTLEGRRKQAELARKYKRKPRDFKLHTVSSQDNIKKYNELNGFDGEKTRIKKENQTKWGTEEFKKVMANRPQCNLFAGGYKNYWKGKKQSEDHKRKKSEAMKAYHKKLKEKK